MGSVQELKNKWEAMASASQPMSPKVRPKYGQKANTSRSDATITKGRSSGSVGPFPQVARPSSTPTIVTSMRKDQGNPTVQEYDYPNPGSDGVSRNTSRDTHHLLSTCSAAWNVESAEFEEPNMDRPRPAPYRIPPPPPPPPLPPPLSVDNTLFNHRPQPTSGSTLSPFSRPSLPPRVPSPSYRAISQPMQDQRPAIPASQDSIYTGQLDLPPDYETALQSSFPNRPWACSHPECKDKRWATFIALHSHVRSEHESVTSTSSGHWRCCDPKCEDKKWRTFSELYRHTEMEHGVDPSPSSTGSGSMSLCQPETQTWDLAYHRLPAEITDRPTLPPRRSPLPSFRFVTSPEFQNVPKASDESVRIKLYSQNILNRHSVRPDVPSLSRQAQYLRMSHLERHKEQLRLNLAGGRGDPEQKPFIDGKPGSYVSLLDDNVSFEGYCEAVMLDYQDELYRQIAEERAVATESSCNEQNHDNKEDTTSADKSRDATMAELKDTMVKLSAMQEAMTNVYNTMNEHALNPTQNVKV